MKKVTHAKEYYLLLELLYSLRMESGLTQTELASRIGMPQSYISKIENGERRVDIVELYKICTALNCDFVNFISQYSDKLKNI